MNIPYTYLIGWSNQNKYYYGVRYSKKCNPNDLWINYFTSSKYVKEFRKLHGEPDVVEIRKTFINGKKAVEWELKVLTKLNVLYNDKWLNKNISGTYKTIKSIPNKLKNKSFEEIYGIEKSSIWKNTIGASTKAWWCSDKGQSRKKELSNNIQKHLTTKGMEPPNKIKDKFILICEFCSTEKEYTKTKNNMSKKTCGSKSCAAKWCYKYKKLNLTLISNTCG